MTYIRAVCPTCGEVILHPEQVHLTVFSPSTGRFRPSSRFEFTCPVCDDEVSQTTDVALMPQLIAAGVPVDVVPDPRERHPSALFPKPVPDAPVPSTRPGASAPPLTFDDLLDLHDELQRDDWFERLLDAGH